jgi:hypothetical protein
MDCARFEAELTELLAHGADAPGRDARIGRLRVHAESCDGCRGSVDLLEWSELPADARDGFDPPGDDYWSSFGERLRGRIERGGGRRRRRVWTVVAAAALFGLALLVVHSLRPEGPTEVAGVAPRTAIDAVDDPTPIAGADDDLEGLLGTLERWYGFDPELSGTGPPEPEHAEGLLPSTADLDPQTRRDLIDWLRQEEARLAGGPV